MTYTFKLARRLAGLPHFGMLALLLSLAACVADDGMAPMEPTWPARADLAVSVSPTALTLEANQVARFSGRIHTPLGERVSAPVSWTATGGTIDSTGAYVAGSTAGTYSVVVANADGTLADTASVIIAAATTMADPTSVPASEPTPEPSPTPEPTPAATLVQVILTPASASLLTGTTEQVAAYGKLSNGDSVAVAVTYSATGGTVTSNGLFTAGTAAGSYHIIAKASSGPADTAAVTLTAPAPAPAPAPVTRAVGIPYGTFSLLSSGGAASSLNLSLDPYNASTIVSQINTARAKGLHLFLALTGGSHANYLTDGVFDRAKWNAKMETFNTPAIATAIAAGVADGTILGASVMDEPNVSGHGDGNTWGPAGTMTKARVDSLCGYVKAIFPTLPAGAVHRYDMFEPTKSYRVCDFMVNQFSARIGSVTAFRDGALAQGKRDGIAIAFSLNILDGGIADKDGIYDCAGRGGMGTYGRNCSMTPEQVREYGTTLGSVGCALLMWRYDANYAVRAANQQAFGDVAARLANLPAKGCRRNYDANVTLDHRPGEPPGR